MTPKLLAYVVSALEYEDDDFPGLTFQLSGGQAFSGYYLDPGNIGETVLLMKDTDGGPSNVFVATSAIVAVHVTTD